MSSYVSLGTPPSQCTPLVCTVGLRLPSEWADGRKFEPKVIDAQVRARLNQKLEESGEKERRVILAFGLERQLREPGVLSLGLTNATCRQAEGIAHGEAD